MVKTLLEHKANVDILTPILFVLDHMETVRKAAIWTYPKNYQQRKIRHVQAHL